MTKSRASINQPIGDALDREFVRETYLSKEWSIKAIAEKLELTIGEVKAIASDLGLNKSKKTIDRQRLIELRSQGLTYDAIAAAMGCTPQGAQKAMYAIEREQGVARDAHEARNDWPELHVEFLKLTYMQPGWSVARIAELLGRTKQSVYNKAFYAGLANRKEVVDG